VLAFHAFPHLSPGGFVGVDVFFVISGYLISTIILHDLAAGRFTYRGFYGRRIRRLLPALVFVLLAVLVAGLFSDFLTELSQLGAHITAGATFLSNIILWREDSYFDVASISKPLLHLWSLGVEEQFYIVWPLALAAMSQRRVPWFITATFLISFTINVATVRNYPAAAFFLPATRIWEFMIGALVAYAGTRAWMPQRQDTFSAIGFTLLAVSLCFINKETAFPGWAALFPTLGAAAIIAAGGNAWLNRTLLANKAAVSLGLISYPLYLWHWPILAFMTVNQGELSLGLKVAALGASFVLASITYIWIEQPLRYGEFGTLKIAGLCAALAALGVTGIALPSCLHLDGRSAFVASFENAAPAHEYMRAHNLAKLWRDECNLYDLAANAERRSISAECTAGSRPSVMLWGDSHAQHLDPGLKATLPPDLAVMQIATSGCLPRLPQPGSDPDNPDNMCDRSNAFALQTIEKTKPDIVVIAQRSDYDATDWTELARALESRGAGTVLLLGPVPQWQLPLHAILARHFWPNSPARLNKWLRSDLFETDRVLKQRYEGSSELRYVSLIDSLCNADGCLTYIGPDPREDIVSFDYGHLTLSSSRYLAEHVITPAIMGLLRDTKLATTEPGRNPSIP
jgi:peptidoglycan/LPS O-acetylase OafA/YrhL